MDKTRIPQPTRRYVVVTWIVAVVIGVGVGIGVGFLTREPWAGIVVGAVLAALMGLSSVSAARRSGRGTIEAAPPWTGDAGIRHHSGGAL